jgi:ABC-2 type transport system permease protein
MTGILVRKLLRDVAVGLALVCLLLFAFQCLWAKVADRIGQVIADFIGRAGVPWEFIQDTIFSGPGKIMQALMGGETINLQAAVDRLSISYIHPLTQTILCVWAIGRTSGAIAGEIDRGTMELLLAQPISRPRLIRAHLCVDLLTIPVLCLSMWAGTWTGAALTGLLSPSASGPALDPLRFLPGLLNAAVLVFAVSGYTLWFSSLGRFRWRVMGIAVLLTLLQFLINVIGQLWDTAAFLRPCTVFYHYQPQPMILAADWYEQAVVWRQLGVLLAVGAAGYLLALWTFVRRDLPAPL